MWWMAIRQSGGPFSVGSVRALPLERVGVKWCLGVSRGYRNPCSSVPLSQVPACHRERERRGGGTSQWVSTKAVKDWPQPGPDKGKGEGEQGGQVPSSYQSLTMYNE